MWSLCPSFAFKTKIVLHSFEEGGGCNLIVLHSLEEKGVLVSIWVLHTFIKGGGIGYSGCLCSTFDLYTFSRGIYDIQTIMKGGVKSLNYR